MSGEYVAELYVESGTYAGETYIAGPFASKSEAQTHANALSVLGQTWVFPILPDSGAVLSAVQS